MRLFLYCLFCLGLSNATLSSERLTEKDAIKAIKNLGKNLKLELQKNMKVSPVQALQVCHLKAMPLTQEISKKGIQVGRVSRKNRNPNNEIKAWMRPYTDQFHNKKVANKKYLVHNFKDGKKGIIFPIKTMPVCLKCHGANVQDGLQTEIKKRYPADKAMGYKVGDIRGFFWAIVP
jgi:hypothetical protein